MKFNFLLIFKPHNAGIFLWHASEL